MATQRIRGINQIDPVTLVGDLTSNGSALSAIKHNRGAGVAPTSSDNFAAGYAIGSMWVHLNKAYICTGNGTWMDLTASNQAPGYFASKWKMTFTPWVHNVNTTSVFDVNCFAADGNSTATDGGYYFGVTNSGLGITTTKPGVYRFDFSISGYCNGAINEFFVYVGDSPSWAGRGVMRYHLNSDDNWTITSHCIISTSYPHNVTWRILMGKASGSTNVYVVTANLTATYLGPVS